MIDRVKAIREHRAWKIAGLLILSLLLTWLFLKAGEVSTESHAAYSVLLRQYQHDDARLSAKVVASYAGLAQNYDGMSAAVNRLRELGNVMLSLPAWMTDEERDKINVQLKALLSAQAEKAGAVDHFQRENAVLRNSTLYLPLAAEALLADGDWPERKEFEDFIRRLFSMELAARRGGGEQELLREQWQRLQAAPSDSARRAQMKQLLVHAAVLIERSPVVSSLVDKVVRLPTARFQEEMTRAYLNAHQAALGRAAYYRMLLYSMALLLLAYALIALLRIEGGRRALLSAHADLAERYEEQRRTEAELRLYGTVFMHASEGMTITDSEARIIAVNPAFCAITGYRQEEVLGRTPAVLNSGRQSEMFYQDMWASLKQTGQWQGEIWNRRKDGGVFPEWLSITAVADEHGDSCHYIGVFIDISERKESEARIHHLAHHDALTGLPNRLLLEDRIEQGMLKSRRSKAHMAIIFIDLDRFKNINDTLGHAVGDILLVQAAQRGLQVLRETDTLCRHGGDEFVVVLPEIESRQDAAHVCQKLLAALCQPYSLAGHELTVSASAGIALYPEDGETASELMQQADAAMYRAKEQGRNTFCFFSHEINTTTLGDLLLENDLFGALDRGELLLHYQPKFDAKSGAMVGAEALMRWQHRQHGLVQPGRFIPLAETSGLINAFGEWALRTVCAQLRAWLDAGLPVVPVAVNISALQFAQQDLPNMLSRLLDEYALSPALIELELTESLLMRNASRASTVLEVLKRMQVRIAIDDFGTGYSSLSYLRQFPAQTLKIDHSFISQIGAGDESARLVSAIIAMAHELKLSVVAEGVETEEQALYLREQGCDQFQGFLYARPLAADEFVRLLRQRILDGGDRNDKTTALEA